MLEVSGSCAVCGAFPSDVFIFNEECPLFPIVEAPGKYWLISGAEILSLVPSSASIFVSW